MTANTPTKAEPFTILLDLDGTLVDPAAGILTSYRHALETLGHVHDPDDDLHWVIGPPLRVTFARLLGPEGDAEAAVSHYRHRYVEKGAIFDATLYPGIIEALATLAAAGNRLVLCTAKPHVYARRVVERFGILPHLAAVYGPEPDGTRDDKGDLIEHIIAVEGFSPANACMVGDRDNDAKAARRHGIPCIGVTWGYGSPDELTGAGAAVLIDAPHELPRACAALADTRQRSAA